MIINNNYYFVCGSQTWLLKNWYWTEMKKNVVRESKTKTFYLNFTKKKILTSVYAGLLFDN